MLRLLSGRDAPVELSRRSADDDGPPLIYRSRLFEVTADGAIIVERPSQIIHDKTFGPGDDIELLLMHNGERLVATTTILDTHIRQLNPRLRMTCYKLAPGRRPQREQRRAFYRVNVAAVPLEPVVLCVKADPESNSDNKQDPFVVEGQLINLSGGGVGVSVRAKRDVLGVIKRTRSFDCTAHFDDGQKIEAPVRVAHLSVRGDDLLYLGLELDIEDQTQARAIQDQLQHLCTEYQRTQLQRRKA